MVRYLHIICLTLLFSLNAYSQITLDWVENGIKINYKTGLEIVESTIDDFEAENEDMAISMERVPRSEESESLLSSFEYGLKELAVDSDLKLIGQPKKIDLVPFNLYSEFISAHDQHKGFVFILQSMNGDFIYEGYLDCYSDNMKACEDVLRGISFR